MREANSNAIKEGSIKGVALGTSIPDSINEKFIWYNVTNESFASASTDIAFL